MEEDIRSLDLVTPRNVQLSAYYKRSFAYYSIKHREPVILTQLIDNLARSKEEIGIKYGEAAQEELKEIIGDLSKLKYEIQTNKPLQKLFGQENDVKHYNNYIEKCASEEGRATHYHTVWLLAECYMYRRIREIFLSRSLLKDYDYFYKNKAEAFSSALPLMETLAQTLLRATDDRGTDTEGSMKKEFIQFLKLNLWGNKCDLSLTMGKVMSSDQFDISELEPNLLVDDSSAVFDLIYNKDDLPLPDVIDIINDNSGYEVFTDFCIADYLISKGLISEVRFHVKSFPWFISDVTESDFMWVINQLMESQNETLSALGEKWNTYQYTGKWKVMTHEFWTYPHEFKHMKAVAPDLYTQLSETRLLIFKGDLNYRKLLGEKNWDPATPFTTSLQDFNPAPLCALRTVKAHLISGLKPGVAEKLDATNPKWMETGDYGVIQYSSKVVHLNDVPN
ncbi:damage-control phosphatase ARMT1 isoform X2 [Aethina tumida]|uniref:damage-control phosphatase ARMT1 isoform X2 n=1 Tax=Aethina tumida TaxID=116153 RepID=UPI0021482399|nr:damage-control phosphatase ARMT1 isoform X2 [Aethina tumida]